MKKEKHIFKTKLKIGDETIVLSGKDRGKKGKIEKIFPQKNLIRVAGVNLCKKHSKKKGQAAGGIVETTKPITASKIALVCPKCHQPSKVGWRILAQERKRICRRCGQEID